MSLPRGRGQIDEVAEMGEGMAGRGESPRKAWREELTWCAHSRGWGRKQAAHRGMRPEWAMVEECRPGMQAREWERIGDG